MKSLRSLGWSGALPLLLLLGLLAASAPAGAQTLTALSNLEQTLTAGSVVPAGLTVNLPPDVIAGLLGGAVEIRMQTNYNPAVSTLTSTFFTAQTGSGSPTNLTQVLPTNIFGSISVNVDRIYTTSRVVMFVGTVSSSSSTPYGNFQGLPTSLSFSYSSDTPPKITNVIAVVGGTLALASATATGTVNITPPPGGGGGGTSGVTIVVTPPSGSFTTGTNSFQVTQNIFALDASKSTSSNPGALTYSWASSPGFQPVQITAGSTATPLITLFNRGYYQVTLTVTDATGATASANVSIDYR